DRERLELRIEENRAALVGRIGYADHAALAPDPDQAVHIDRAMLEHQLALQAPVERDPEHRHPAILIVIAIGRVQIAIDCERHEAGGALRRDLDLAQRYPVAAPRLAILIGPPVEIVAVAPRRLDAHHANIAVPVAQIIERAALGRFDRRALQADG